MPQEVSKQQELENIARKFLGVKTFRIKGNDTKDVHNVGIWDIRAALYAAYAVGTKARR